MYKNDRMPEATTSATSNTKKCASTIKTVLAHRREKSLPSLKKNQDFDANNDNKIQDFDLKKSNKNQDVDSKKCNKNENESNATGTRNGISLKRVYNVENAKVVSPGFKTGKQTKKKRHHSPSEKAQNREHLKKLQRRSKEKHNLALIKSKGKVQKSADKTAHGQSRISREKAKSTLNLQRSLDPHKAWKMLSPNSGDLIQATDSATKRYIISVIKKCNRTGKRKVPVKTTQTSRKIDTQLVQDETRRRSVKTVLRKPLWQLAKASIKHSEHWSNFLAANNIVLENINIDKFDLSLIDVDALGIENKLLKRTIMWLFK